MPYVPRHLQSNSTSDALSGRRSANKGAAADTVSGEPLAATPSSILVSPGTSPPKSAVFLPVFPSVTRLDERPLLASSLVRGLGEREADNSAGRKRPGSSLTPCTSRSTIAAVLSPASVTPRQYPARSKFLAARSERNFSAPVLFRAA